jgi:hypothetical protein
MKMLPEDAHERCSGKVHIAITVPPPVPSNNINTTTSSPATKHPVPITASTAGGAAEAATSGDVLASATGAEAAVLAAFPRGKPMLVSEFSSKEDLVSAVAASSFIPFWSDQKPVVDFR